MFKIKKLKKFKKISVKDRITILKNKGQELRE